MVSARGCPGSTCISPVWLERCKLSLSLPLSRSVCLSGTLGGKGPPSRPARLARRQPTGVRGTDASECCDWTNQEAGRAYAYVSRPVFVHVRVQCVLARSLCASGGVCVLLPDTHVRIPVWRTQTYFDGVGWYYIRCYNVLSCQGRLATDRGRLQLGCRRTTSS